MLLPAVFTVSLTSLCYEVLLTRYFSFSQWNHLSFMVISIVLFGFGAAGSLLSLVESRRPGWAVRALDFRLYRWLLIACAAAVSGSFLAVRQIPLDYFRMPLEGVQVVYLLLTFVLLLIPFFCAGSVISAAFAAAASRSGWIYFASMFGSAVGAVLPALLLPALGEGRIVIGCSLLLLVVSLPARPRPQPLPVLAGRVIPPVAAALLLFAAAALLCWGGGLLAIQPSPYKLLAQVLQFPDTRITARSNTIRGRLDTVESPHIRFAPGLSLKYAGVLPRADFLIQDGDALFTLYDTDRVQTLRFSRYLHCFAGYLLRPAPENALILQHGGGLSLPCALSADVEEITLLLEHPEAAAVYERRYTVQAGESGPGVHVVPGNMRRFLALDPTRYDRIQVESWGPSVPGTASLNQEHLLTVEAFASYLRHLEADGVLILSRRLLLPPSDSLKVFAASFRALQSIGAEDPGRHILMIRGWDSYTLLCSPTPFGSREIRALQAFCREMNFDVVFHREMAEEEANRFNSFAEAFHFHEIRALYRALAEERARAYFRDYDLDVCPARDDRPFHSRFSRWTKLGALYRSTGSRLYTLLLSGETVVLAVLGIAAAFGTLLLLLPRLFAPRARHKAQERSPWRTTRGRSNLRAVLYFLSAGAGFMFVEMAFLQGYTFVFGDPVVAFTVVLAVLLVMSGVGGAVSAGWKLHSLPPLLALLAACLLVLMLLFAPLQRLLLSLPAGGFVAAALLAAIALMMGVPFPVALRLLASSARHRAFGWAANGVASVVASILAVPLAMSWGISRLLLLAALCYASMLLLLLVKD